MVTGELSVRRRQVLDGVADLICAPERPRGARVGIDGVSGAGKTTFATHLAAVLAERGREVVHVSADGFHHPEAIRYRRGRRSAEGFWLDSYDYPALRENVLDPFSPGGPRRYRPAVHDVVHDRILDLPWRTAPTDAVLVVDGLFLHRDELAGAWDFSVFLEVPFTVTAARMALRNGSHPDPEHPSMHRYVGGEGLYLAACSPWQRADVVIDNSDHDDPTILETGR